MLCYLRVILKTLVADECVLADNVDGANVGAETASDTLLVIDNGKIVVHRDSTVGAGSHTLGTTETSVGAHLSCECALVVVGASDSNDGILLEDLDSAARTGLCAETATGTACGNYRCNAVLDNDSLVGTNRRTVTETDAREGTNVFALPMLSRLFTRGHSVAEMLFVLFGSLAGTVTSNVSVLSFSRRSLNTENCRNILGSLCTAGNAEVGCRGLTLADSSCIAVTTAEAAGTAVASGKCITDLKESFILFYSKEDICYCKYDRADSGDRKTNDNR